MCIHGGSGRCAGFCLQYYSKIIFVGKICMEYLKYSFSEIKDTNRNGITFISGEKINFKECIKRRYNSETCVAERDISAQPPYFEFFTPNKTIRIVFDKKGLFSKSKNSNYFLKLQMTIIEYGYSSYDLS